LCAEVLEEAQKPKNPLRIRGEKLRRNNVVDSAGEDSSRRALKGKKTKVKAFWTLEILPSAGRKHRHSEGAIAAIRLS
jgi:hypothetical protein